MVAVSVPSALGASWVDVGSMSVVGEPQMSLAHWVLPARPEEAQRIGSDPGDQRLRQSMSLAVSRQTTARAT